MTTKMTNPRHEATRNRLARLREQEESLRSQDDAAFHAAWAEWLEETCEAALRRKS